MNNEITRCDEEKFLSLKIANNKYLSMPVNFYDIIECIKNKKIPLEITGDDGTPVLDEENFLEIKKTIPYLFKIVNKPKTFIRVQEEKVPVEIVKRINYKAMVQLSKNSNDWHARTITNVKPKNILTDNNEESLDLYENRLVCTLIDKILTEILKRKRLYEQEKSRVESIIDSRTIDSYYNYQKESFTFYREISKIDAYPLNDGEYAKKIDNELDEICSVERKIRILKQSDFYRIVHKKRKVTNPVVKTNIFIFDANYNKAYKLWNYLNSYHEEQKLEPRVELEKSVLDYNYEVYCLLCVFSSLYDLKYNESTKRKINFSNNSITFEDKLVFNKGESLINLWINDNNIHLSYNYDVINDKWDEFVFKTTYDNFEEKKATEIANETCRILDELSEREKFCSITGRYCFLSINMNNCFELSGITEKICRRFYSIGNNFSNEENEKNLENWSNYKAGLCIITPSSLKNNFLRIEKIINYHILKHIDLNSIECCPLCGGKYINNRSNYGIDYVCNDCNHKIAYTYCNFCDEEHRNPILWIEYKDDRFLSSEDVIDGKFNERKIYDKISKIEGIMGEKAVTSFELEKEKDNWKLKTICPRCGKKLGQK